MANRPDPISGTPLAGPVILVAMPDALVLLDVVQVVSTLGFRKIVTAATLAGLAKLVARDRHDAAILDCDFLNSHDSGTIAQLASLESRLLLLSGYGAELKLPASFERAVVLQKPVSSEAIRRHLARLAGQRGSH